MHRGEAPGEGRGSSGWDVQQVSSSQKAVPGHTGMLLGDERGDFVAMGLSPANQLVQNHCSASLDAPVL